METHGEDKYLYIVEWDDSVIRPQAVVAHRIALHPEANEEDFEKFMMDEAFPTVFAVSTRAGGVSGQYLLKESDVPDRFEDLDVSLEPFGTRTSFNRFRKVAGDFVR